MLGNTPPYALDTFGFSLPALASCAGRAPLGSDRELALGVWMAARLALGIIPPLTLPSVERTLRAEKAKNWLGSLTLPQPARLALFRAFDASATYPPRTADALAELARLVIGHIDSAAQDELAAIVNRLRAVTRGTDASQPPPEPPPQPPPQPPPLTSSPPYARRSE